MFEDNVGGSFGRASEILEQERISATVLQKRKGIFEEREESGIGGTFSRASEVFTKTV